MEIVILHSTEEEFLKFCKELIQALSEKHGSVVALTINGHENSVTVSQELETRRGSFLVLVLDEKLTEILEHKKSRKLFTKISSYVEDKRYIFLKHSVTEETWTELKEDLDLQNPSYITCEGQTVRQIAEAVSQYIASGENAASRVATESDEAEPLNESLGQCRLEPSQWTPLNPESFVSLVSNHCENGSLPTRGQPEGTSQPPTDQNEANDDDEERNDSESTGSQCDAGSQCDGGSRCDTLFITCSQDDDQGRCDSTQLAVSGQSVTEVVDEISREKAKIRLQEEMLACSSARNSTDVSETEQGTGDTCGAGTREEENIATPAETTESTTTSLPLPTGQHIQMNFNNIPNLNVLCGGTLDNNSVGTQMGSPGLSGPINFPERNQNDSRFLSGGSIQSPVLPFSMNSLRSDLPRMTFNSASQLAERNSNCISGNFDSSVQSQPQTDVTSYLRQGSFQGPWNPSITYHPGTCPQCHQYRDNIIHFFGREGFDLHSCSSVSNSGPEALSYMCNECLASIPGWDNNQRRTGPKELASNFANVPMQAPPHSIRSATSQPRQITPQNNPHFPQNIPPPPLSLQSIPPRQGAPHPYAYQPGLPNIPNGERKMLNSSFNGGPVERMYVTDQQPHSAPVYTRQNMGFPGPQPRSTSVNTNNLTMANLRPQILLMDQRMRNAGQQQGQYNIQVNNSASTNSDNNISDSMPSTFDSGKSNQSPVKQTYRLQPIINQPHPRQDEIGPSGGASFLSVTHSDPGGASAADSSGDINLMDLSQEVMECIQNNMDYSSSQYNWERLATLHGWSFGKIYQLRQRWKQRQVDSPFLELLGREEFQNYTLRQLREDLTKIPRKDILEKLKMYEERGELTPAKCAK